MADPDRPSWWQTVPGMLTGAAALVGAIAGLIGVLGQVGLPPIGSPPSPAPTDAVSPIPPQTRELEVSRVNPACLAESVVREPGWPAGEETLAPAQLFWRSDKENSGIRHVVCGYELESPVQAAELHFEGGRLEWAPPFQESRL
jgi:hypothetical protein